MCVCGSSECRCAAVCVCVSVCASGVEAPIIMQLRFGFQLVCFFCPISRLFPIFCFFFLLANGSSSIA